MGARPALAAAPELGHYRVMIAGRGADCLEEETIAAFVAGLLAGVDLTSAEAHLAVCGVCRQITGDAAYGARTDTRERAGGGSSAAAEADVAIRRAPGPGEIIAGKYRVEHT